MLFVVKWASYSYSDVLIECVHGVRQPEAVGKNGHVVIA